ncbi:MAG: hypothetical protein KDN22_14425, partial [Verrucomicrobiae bacterium]|nr:hypothetical protein [Verrucomicrobiae bacterium]
MHNYPTPQLAATLRVITDNSQSDHFTPAALQLTSRDRMSPTGTVAGSLKKSSPVCDVSGQMANYPRNDHGKSNYR